MAAAIAYLVTLGVVIALIYGAGVVSRSFDRDEDQDHA